MVLSLAFLILVVGIALIGVSIVRSDNALKPGEVERLLKDD